MTATDPAATPKLASYFSKLNPIPAFPEYTGPYKVGTMDVEIPVSDLSAPSPAPPNAKGIETVQFRVFYPAVAESTEKRINWLPAPQRQHVAAYTQFMGVGQTLAGFLSFLPRHLHYSTIPVHKNATIEKATTEDGRWPTMIFSHGLGGSRNSYSYIAGSLASHGVVVFCPEHRDGSAVVSFIRLQDQVGRFFTSSARRVIPYNRIAHEVTPEVYEAREAQLRIRLWEMGLAHEAILAMDKGESFTNLNLSTPSLEQFAGQLDVHRPGSIIFAGHSFGAATIHQLLKTTFYADVPEVKNMGNPLFTPAANCSLRKQVTERSVTMLLDMWCLPLLAPNSAPLFRLPLPVYADRSTSAGGSALLAVESEAFYKWTEQLHVKARLLSPDPSAEIVSAELYEKPSGIKLPEPNFFYVANSAHLNQSDFGVLFPMLTKRVFDAQQPERALRLNLRAQLQLLRANGVPVARTYAGDLVDGAHVDKLNMLTKVSSHADTEDGINDDKAIFDRSGNDVVDHWHWIDIIGLGEAGTAARGLTAVDEVEASEPAMQGELEPNQQPTRVAVTAAIAVDAAA